MRRIKIYEDDEFIYKELATLLINNDYEVVTEGECDLYLLDINMQEESGFDICERIRSKENTPIIFLTARNTPQDELWAFNIGADDYIIKPFNPHLLLARIKRLVNKSSNDIVEKEGIKLILPELKVVFNDKEAFLTKTETLILHCLMNGDIVSNKQLIEKLWTDKLYIDESAIYVNITRLRNKLNDIGLDNKPYNIRGVGYKL